MGGERQVLFGHVEFVIMVDIMVERSGAPGNMGLESSRKD